MLGADGLVARVEGERSLPVPPVSSPVDAPENSPGKPRLLSGRPPGPVLLQLVVLRDDGVPREPDDDVDCAIDDNVGKEAAAKGWLAGECAEETR